MSAYQYEPLLFPDSIRLLLLQPCTSHDAELNGSLLNTTLVECDYDLIDNYTALSYVWGSDEKPCQILLDGHVFAITRSLNDALHGMRDVTRVRKIWADAICINQQNVSERNNQVLIMGRIYATAHSTIIYFGNLTDKLTVLFDAISHEYYHQDCRSPSVSSDDDSRGLVAGAVAGGSPFPRPIDPEAFRPFTLDSVTEGLKAPTHAIGNGYIAVLNPNKVGDRGALDSARADVLANPWFSRVWVLQEMVLSKDPWIQYSRKRVRWADLRRLFKDPRPWMTSRVDASIMDQMDLCRENKHAEPLHSIVQRRRSYGAQDPRDFIYAHLSITGDPGDVRRHLKVDYSYSASQVFSDMALYTFNCIELRKFVSLVDDIPAEDRMPGLPSWAADWRQRPVPRVPLYGPMSSSSHGFFAESFQDGKSNGRFHSFTKDNLPLVLGHLGLTLDVVESVSSVMPCECSLETLIPITEEYEKAREQLAKYGMDDLNALNFGDRNPCYALGTAWVSWFEKLDELTQAGSRGNSEFITQFSEWIYSRPKDYAQRVLSDQYASMLACIAAYFDGRGDEYGELVRNRRLAFTRDGGFGLFPSQTKKGDVIGFLKSSPTPVLFRPKESARSEQIDQSLADALGRQFHLLRYEHAKSTENPELRYKPMGVESSGSLGGETDWPVGGKRSIQDKMNTTSKDELIVEHCSIVGECYLEDFWTLAFPSVCSLEYSLRVFALH